MNLRAFLLAACAAFILTLPASADDAPAVPGNAENVPANTTAVPASAATVPADDSTFESFRNFCVATHADANSALAAADKAGWMPIPKMMLDSFPPIVYREPQGRLRTTASSFIIVVVAHGNPFPDMDMDSRICAVAVMPADSATNLATNAVQFAAVPEYANPDPNNHIYMWHEDKDGTHLEVNRSTPHLKSLFEKGLVNMLMVRSDSKMTIAGFAVMSK